MTLLHFDKVFCRFPVYEGLFRRLVGHVHAVNGIDLTLQEGRVLALVGESGCGKSTLARIAVGLLPPTAGSVFFEGKPVETCSKKDIAIIFQDPLSSLSPRKTIGQNLTEPVLFHKIAKTEAEAIDHIVALLVRVGLSKDILDRFPHQFSGGQQQRICIARALSLEPRLLVCDEIVSALDVSIQAQIVNLLLELKNEFKLTMLFITHDLSLLPYIADEVAVLYLGHLMEKGRVDDVFQNPSHPYTKALLSAVPISHPALRQTKKRLSLFGELPSPMNLPSGCPFRTRCPFVTDQCARDIPKKERGASHFYHCLMD